MSIFSPYHLLPKYPFHDTDLWLVCTLLSLLASILWKIICLLVCLLRFSHLDRNFIYTWVVPHPEIHLAKKKTNPSTYFTNSSLPASFTQEEGFYQVFGGPIFFGATKIGGNPAPSPTKETTAWVWTFFPAKRQRWRTGREVLDVFFQRLVQWVRSHCNVSIQYLYIYIYHSHISIQYIYIHHIFTCIHRCI